VSEVLLMSLSMMNGSIREIVCEGLSCFYLRRYTILSSLVYEFCIDEEGIEGYGYRRRDGGLLCSMSDFPARGKASSRLFSKEGRAICVPARPQSHKAASSSTSASRSIIRPALLLSLAHQSRKATLSSSSSSRPTIRSALRLPVHIGPKKHRSLLRLRLSLLHRLSPLVHLSITKQSSLLRPHTPNGLLVLALRPS
jgi:hypothetical protein